jgi:hypothetical protein
MAVVVAISAGGIGFLLVFLGALLREPKRRRPHSALLLQLAEHSGEELASPATEPELRAKSAGAAD